LVTKLDYYLWAFIDVRTYFWFLKWTKIAWLRPFKACPDGRGKIWTHNNRSDGSLFKDSLRADGIILTYREHKMSTKRSTVSDHGHVFLWLSPSTTILIKRMSRVLYVVSVCDFCTSSSPLLASQLRLKTSNISCSPPPECSGLRKHVEAFFGSTWQT